MKSVSRLLTSSVMLIACFGPTVIHAADQDEPIGAPSNVNGPSPAADTLEQVSPTGSGVPFYIVRLHVDANLVGRVRLSRNPGKPTPVNADIAFFHEGSLVDSTHTNESGYFQLTNLTPGDYTATIVTRGGSTEIGVKVRPFDEDATPEEMLLDLILELEPIVVVEVLEEEIAECPIIPMAGGHHKHGLLGLAGLAGLAGLGGDGDGDGVATPFKLQHH